MEIPADTNPIRMLSEIGVLQYVGGRRGLDVSKVGMVHEWLRTPPTVRQVMLWTPTLRKTLN
jgi:hypothetical protein